MTDQVRDLVATARAQQQCAPASTVGSLDVIVVDDHVAQSKGWFDAYLGPHRRLGFASVAELESFLAGEVPPHLADAGPWNPAVALVDLDLGVGSPTGLAAVRALVDRPPSDDLLIVLATNGLHDARDLLAVLCAEVNGGGILRAGKDDVDGPRVAELLDWVAANRRVGAPSIVTGPVAGLQLIHAVTVHSATSGDRIYPLGELLLDEEWKRRFWELLARTKNYPSSLLEALDQYDAYHDPKKERMREKRQSFARERRNKGDFGMLPVALEAAGGNFCELPDGRLALGLQPEHVFGKQRRRERVRHTEIAVAFAARYAAALTLEEAGPRP